MSAVQKDFPFPVEKENVNVRWVVDTLKANGWTTRRELLRQAGLAYNDWNARWIRKLMEAAGDDVVKGQKGFNHIKNCTVEEMREAAKQSISQGKEMVHYGIRLLRRAHAMVGGTPK